MTSSSAFLLLLLLLLVLLILFLVAIILMIAIVLVLLLIVVVEAPSSRAAPLPGGCQDSYLHVLKLSSGSRFKLLECMDTCPLVISVLLNALYVLSCPKYCQDCA